MCFPAKFIPWLRLTKEKNLGEKSGLMLSQMRSIKNNDMKGFRYLLGIVLTSLICSTAFAQTIEWKSMEEAQNLASQNNKKVMLYAEAEWCGYCKKMNKQVFPKASVADSLNKYFYPVRIDIESDRKLTFNGKEYTEKSLSRKFQVYSTPTTIFFDSNGKVIGTQPGFLPSEVFDKLLAYVGSGLYGKIEFETYLSERGIEIGQ
jgi:thioredoxin-related protein